LTKDADGSGSAPDSRTDASETPRFLVRTLLQGRREVILEHNGQDYRLRVTASGKLILTK
jgi:hemin uptake protein HemP